MSFPDGYCVRPYHDLQEYTGHAYTTESNGIDMEMYKSGWILFAFMLTNSMENDPCFELIKDGTVAVNIKFNHAVPAGGLIMVAYAPFNDWQKSAIDLWYDSLIFCTMLFHNLIFF